MEYRLELDIAEDRDVYPPSDDTLMLIEALDVRRGMSVLEIGCGSGCVSIHCALCGAEVTCGDINPRAVELTRKNARMNGVTLNVVTTDVYSAVEGRFDLIFFNLPYLPVEEEGGLEKAWAGGSDGIGPLPRLLEGAPEHLLPGGKVVIVVSNLMGRIRMGEILKGRLVRVLKEESFFFEKLQVLEISFRVGNPS